MGKAHKLVCVAETRINLVFDDIAAYHLVRSFSIPSREDSNCGVDPGHDVRDDAIAPRGANRYNGLLSAEGRVMSFWSRRQALKNVTLLSAVPLLPTIPQPPTAVKKKQAPQEKKDPYADGKLVDGPPAKAKPGSFSIVVLPDTQHYSEKFPDTYLVQTRWIVEQKKDRNIAAVLHLGDITNHSTPAEWKNAVKAMDQLDGHVPYFFINGNHDYSEGGSCKDRTTLLNEYFPIAKFQNRPNFGGVYDREPDRMENSYHRFSAGGRDFLVLGLEFGPRKDVVRWANEVVAKHPKHEVIMITHAFIYFDDTRYNWKKYGAKQSWNPHAYGVAKTTGDDVTDGEELWNTLVSKHENFILTLNGHVLGDGLGRYHSTTPGGRDVQQLLVNFQMRPKGGDGWLRILEFQPDGKTVDVCDYSPTRGQRNESPQNKFTFTTAAPKV